MSSQDSPGSTRREDYPRLEEPLSDHARAAHRQRSELTMESFITSQLNTILQPVLAHIEEIDDKVAKNESDLAGAKAEIIRNANAIDNADESIGHLKGRMNEAESRNLGLHEGLDKNDKKTDQVLQDLAKMTADVKRMHDRLEDNERGVLPVLQRDIQHLEEKQLQTRRHLEAVAAIVDDHPLKKDIQVLNNGLSELTGNHANTGMGLAKLRSEVDDTIRKLSVVCQVADKNRATGVHMQNTLQEVVVRENSLQQQINGWKDQWSKLHPEIQACAKDLAQNKQRTDHHDAAIQSLQQGQLHSQKGLDALQHNQEKIYGEQQQIGKELSVAQGDLQGTRTALNDAVKFSNALHSNLEDTCGKLRKTTADVEGLERKHLVAVDDLDRTSTAVHGLQNDHRKATTAMQTVQRELERTKDALHSTRTDLASTNTNIEGVKGDLGKANSTLHRLDHGVEFCSAGFSGLQKGFMATGSNIQQRKSVALPSVTTPRPRTGNTKGDFMDSMH